MRFVLFLLGIVLVSSCSLKTENTMKYPSVSWDEAAQLEINAAHESPRMQYKLIQSKFASKMDVWHNAHDALDGFSGKDYRRLSPLIYEQDIPSIQAHIKAGELTYENLVKWYIFRIVKYESNPKTSLHAIISLNEEAIHIARERDANRSDKDHPIYGMPILLKDNINAAGSATTAGAILLAENDAADATIVKNLKDNGAIILGKVNLSEWAYYFCDGCPLGYSAVGGQTLNPYGRFVFETGGSSAGSGVVMAANYATGAVGTETAGSIISPSSQNSIIGLKPTIGVLSRTGIVPISNTLDTPGPMTRNVVDNAILLSAMSGKDDADKATLLAPEASDFYKGLEEKDISDLRLGANTYYLGRDSLYTATVNALRDKGATIVNYTPGKVELKGFIDILNYDMQRDLPEYFKHYTGKKVAARSVSDVIEFNKADSLLRAPYGQGRLIASRDDTTGDAEIEAVKKGLEKSTRAHYVLHFEAHDLDAILSINNFESAIAALAKLPCLSMPMGYTSKGEPKAMTFIGKRFMERELLQAGRAFEKALNNRIPPSEYGSK